MSAETYSIFIKVDSTQAKTAAQDLAKMGEASVKAEVSLKKMGSTSTAAADSSKTLSSALNNTSNTTQKAASAFDSMTKAANSVRSAFVLLVGMEVARFMREAAGSVREAADAYTDMTSRLNIATVSQIEMAKAMRESSAIAEKYYTNITDVATAYAKFNPILATLGRSQADTEKVVSSLSASLLVSGANVTDAAESFRQFAQAISGPVVQMEEMNTIIDSNQALWRGLNRELAPLVSKYGSLKNAISANAVTNEMLVNATIKLGKEFDDLAAKKIPTIGNALTVLNNKFIEYVGQTDKSSGMTKSFSTAIVEFANNLDKVLNPIAKITPAFAELAVNSAKLVAELGPLAEGFLNFLGVLAQIESSAIKNITNLVDALEALAGSTEKFKQVTDINMAVVNDKTLAGIEAEINLNKERLRQYKELGATNEQNSAQIKFLEDKLDALNKTKEAYFAQADAAKKAEREEMARIDAQRKANVIPPGIDEKAAKKARDEAEKNFTALLDFQVAQAENAAKIFKAQSDTKLEQIESEKKALRDAAEIELVGATEKEDRIRIYKKLQEDIEAQIVKESEVKQQLLQTEVDLNQIRIDSANQLLAKSAEYQFSQAEILRIQKEIAGFQTSIDIAPEQAKQLEIEATDKLRASAEGLNKALVDTKDAQKDVREEALRTLAVFESNLDFAREMATGFADAFGEMGEAIGGMVVSLAEYEKQMATIKIQMEEDIAKNPAKRYEIEQKAAEKSAKAQINAYGDMTQSAQKFFKQGSKGYEAMGAAVKVFRAFEMAQSVISTVSQIDDMGMMLAQFLGMETAKTTAKVASNTAQQASDSQAAVVSAQKAVADSGQGDPYTGIVRAAAMLAFMAAIGIAIGGGSSASASSTPKLPGTGTVLGDPEAQSQSIQNALDTLVEINTNDLSYSAGMLQSLKNIENALASAAALTARMVMPLIDRVMSSTGAGSMLSSSEITKAGFIGQPQLLTEILQSGYMKGGMGYRKETTTLSILNSAEEVIVKWPKKIGETFAKIVDEMFTTIVDSGKSVGVSIETIQERAVGLKLKLGEMNLAGKSSEEQAAAIEAAFSAMGDTMAKKLLPEFVGFQKSGEGYFETIVRVGAGIKDATGRLEQLGYEAIDYTQIINKHGDVAAEIAKQTLVQQALLGEGVKVYVSELQGGVEDVISAYKQLVDVQNIYVGIGGNMDNLTRTMINAAGGLDAFQEAMQTFVQNFLPPAEQIRITGAGLAKDFARFGFTMPQTRDEFAKLVMGLDDTTEAGQKLKGQLIGLTPAFDDYISQVEDLNDEFKDLFANIKDFQSSIRDDIANLTGSSAEFALAVTNAQDAYKALFDQIGYADYRITGSQEEIDLLKEVRSQVMARYNAEVAILRQVAQVQADAIREASAAEIQGIKDALAVQQDAINAAADAQVESINSASEAQIDAINSALDAELEMRQKAHEAALESLQKEYDAAQKLKTAVEQVRAYAQGMALGPNAPTSPEQRLREAQRQYSDLLSRAQGGDADAIGQLSGAADAYLQASKDYYGSGTQYANIFDGVKKAMESIGSIDVTDPESIQARIDLLRESQQKELEALRETAQAQVEGIRDSAKSQVDAVKDAAKAQIEAAKSAADAQIKTIQDSAQEQIKNLTDIEKNAAIRDLRDKTIIELQNLYELSEKIDAAAKLRQSEMDQVARDNLKAAQDSASYLATLVGASGSSTNSGAGSTSTGEGINSTMQAVATETKASVNIQREAFPKMIERLGELSDRLAKIERNQRLSA